MRAKVSLHLALPVFDPDLYNVHWLRDNFVQLTSTKCPLCDGFFFLTKFCCYAFCGGGTPVEPRPCLTWVLIPFLYCRGKSSLLSWRKFPVLSTPLPSLLFLRRHVVRTVIQSHLICSRSTTVYFKIILVLNQAYFNI